MSKSVYSLVLTDQVVAAVDSLACKKGWSRSNIIDAILAEYVSFDTTDMRMRDIFDEMEKILTQHRSLRFSNMASHSMVSIVSALPYKYKPTVKYSLELYESDNTIGKLKVTLRTQSSQLIEEMQQFFSLLSTIEGHYLNRQPDARYFCGKFERVLLKLAEMNSYSIATAITSYVVAIDSMLTYWFASDRQQQDVATLSQMYGNYIKQNLPL